MRVSPTYEDDCGKQGLLVVVDPPLALESQGEDGEDHHLYIKVKLGRDK